MTDAFDPQAIAEIEQRLAAFTDTGPLMERLGRVMLTDVKLNFRRATAPDGTPWAPLKLRKGKPLRDTGRLMRSYGYDADDQEVTVGTNTSYAPTHHFGAVIRLREDKQVTIPARPALGLADPQIKKINRAIEQWAKEQADQ